MVTKWFALCFCTCIINRWFILHVNDSGSEPKLLCYVTYLPREPASTVECSQWIRQEALLHRLGSEISSWLGHELEAKSQPHFHDPPPPLQWWQQYLAPTAVVVLLIVLFLFFLPFLTSLPRRCARWCCSNHFRLVLSIKWTNLWHDFNSPINFCWSVDASQSETPNAPNVRLLCCLPVQCVLHNIWGIFGLLRFAAACESLRQCYKNVLSIHPPLSTVLYKKQKNTFVFLPVKQDTDHYVNAKQKPYRLSVDSTSKKLCASVAKN